MPTTMLNHESLGSMRGLLSEDGKTVQFRGIKYASIPGRWQDPILETQKLGQGNKELDATKHGPSCPQHPAAFAFDLSLVGNVALTRENEECSELECLNLIVVVPIEALEQKEKLPVMVWVHGGGLSAGGSNWPQYDISNFVAASVDIGKPVVGVSINYRVGILGFLASEELGISGNFGLKDQICAFKWVKNNIQEFGGNPEKVTAFGESAGSILISTLLLTDDHLFSKAIMMSGDTTLRKPRTKAWQNNFYQTQVTLLGLDDLTPDDRRSALHALEADGITSRLPPFQGWSPTVDGTLIRNEVDLGMISDINHPAGKPSWCEAIMTGDVAHDGTVLKARIMDAADIMSRLQNALVATLDPVEVVKVLQKYDLDLLLGPKQQYDGLLELATDLRFHFMVLKVAEGWNDSPGKARDCVRYHFHQANEVEGNYKGYVSHELDVAYLLQTMSSSFTPESQELGKMMASAWIRFAYGEELNDGNVGVLVIGPGKNFGFVGEEEYDEKYRRGRGKLLLELGWKKCMKLGEMLQGVYP